MDPFQDGILAEKREKYPDILLTELLASAPSFRDWFIGQTPITQERAHSVDVRVNETTEGRETDVLFRFKDGCGERHLILIENKIKAQEQPSQLLDYHDRGQLFVERDQADSFTICLLAPERWLAADTGEKVDAIITYEDVINQLANVDHDASSFIRSVFKECVEAAETSVPDLTDITDDLWARIRTNADQGLISRPNRPAATRKNVRCISSHPDHPGWLNYRIYIGNPDDYGKTSLSLEVDFSEDSFPERDQIDKYTLKSRFGRVIAKTMTQQDLDLDGEYEHDAESKNTILRIKLGHDGYRAFGSEEYRVAVVEEFCYFVDTVHSIIEDVDFDQIAGSQS